MHLYIAKAFTKPLCPYRVLRQNILHFISVVTSVTTTVVTAIIIIVVLVKFETESENMRRNYKKIFIADMCLVKSQYIT